MRSTTVAAWPQFCSGGLVSLLCLTLVTPWTIACQAPLSLGFSRQEYWSRLDISYIYLKKKFYEIENKTWIQQIFVLIYLSITINIFDGHSMDRINMFTELRIKLVLEIIF